MGGRGLRHRGTHRRGRRRAGGDEGGHRGGDDVLDVATGTGNTALAAWAAGAVVTGLDLAPELLDVARQRSAKAGADITWVPGDAEALPFPHASFDHVLSTFGVQFVPRHDVVAAELERAVRPGGRVVLTTWTHDGVVGRLFALLGENLPPLPPFASPPHLWGEEGHVRRLLDGVSLVPTFELHAVRVPAATPEEYVEFLESTLGPVIKAREALEPAGRWAQVRDEWVALAGEFHDDGAVEQAYWLVVAEDATSWEPPPPPSPSST
jgi:ubiquinone/menaquinone biosynthesis C-methylase UbiE